MNCMISVVQTQGEILLEIQFIARLLNSLTKSKGYQERGEWQHHQLKETPEEEYID